MKIVILEDEFPAQERLKLLINEFMPHSEIVAILDSISSALNWFRSHKEYDLIFSDMQLADGISLQIFEQVEIKKPIIFITAYDEYALSAFKYFSLDYLLKPIVKQDFRRALEKYHLLKYDEKPFDAIKVLRKIQGNVKNYKTRFLVNVGNKNYPLNVENISLFFIRNQGTFIYTKEGNSYLIDLSLDEIEKSLNPNYFFRINRQMILSIDAIDSFESYINGRLFVKLNSSFPDEVIVSKRRANAFKEWLN